MAGAGRELLIKGSMFFCSVCWSILKLLLWHSCVLAFSSGFLAESPSPDNWSSWSPTPKYHRFSPIGGEISANQMSITPCCFCCLVGCGPRNYGYQPHNYGYQLVISTSKRCGLPIDVVIGGVCSVQAVLLWLCLQRFQPSAWRMRTRFSFTLPGPQRTSHCQGLQSTIDTHL